MWWWSAEFLIPAVISRLFLDNLSLCFLFLMSLEMSYLSKLLFVLMLVTSASCFPFLSTALMTLSLFLHLYQKADEWVSGLIIGDREARSGQEAECADWLAAEGQKSE